MALASLIDRDEKAQVATIDLRTRRKAKASAASLILQREMKLDL
jgi:hypothetical protein